MKTNLLLLTLLFFASCQEKPATTNSSSSGSDDLNPPPPEAPVQTLTQPMIRVKNYNQYNMTLEKLTGINRSQFNELFETLKGSLPADNEISGLTPFNLVAMTRLADAYCGAFVNAEETTGLAGKLATINVTDTRSFLFDKFLDVEDINDYASLVVEVENVLKNDDGQGGELFPNSSGSVADNKALVVAACVTVLSSPYITLLE